MKLSPSRKGCQDDSATCESSRIRIHAVVSAVLFDASWESLHGGGFEAGLDFLIGSQNSNRNRAWN